MYFSILSLLNERKLEELGEKWWTFNKNRKKCQNGFPSSKGIGIRGTLGIFVAIFTGFVLKIWGSIIVIVLMGMSNQSYVPMYLL